MGQAAVLPDPLDEKAPPIGNADDLLSQLAGEEIERLLSENDAASADAAPPTPDATGERSRVEASDVDLGALAQQVEQEATEHTPGTPPVTEPASPVEPTALTRASPATVPPSPPPPAPAEPSGDSAAKERAALRLGPAAPATVAAAAGSAPVPSDESDDALPAYLKPLEWLNAPLAWCPESMRDAMGKVALVTLFNAVAVLLYVMLFRR